jgi:hypothetical protein
MSWSISSVSRSPKAPALSPGSQSYNSSACCGASVLSRLVRSIFANECRSVRPCRVRSACSQHTLLLMFFLALVHRFSPWVDNCFIPCSGSHVHLTAGPFGVSSYKLVMLRNLSGYLHVWRRILRTKKNSILICSFTITLKNSYSKHPHSRRQTASDVSRSHAHNSITAL